MQSDNSGISKEVLESSIEILKATDAGQFDGLKCPGCHALTIRAWFTIPAANEYRIWAICDECDWEQRAICDGRPRSFDPGRVNQRLEEYDRQLLARLRFKGYENKNDEHPPS